MADNNDNDYTKFNDQRVPVNIEDEMRKSYLDYAMSVIIGRALPDVRDGSKPVQRRVLFGMYEQGNTAGKAYKKSARIVGDVMGKYHPHGDSAIYDTVVRMAQDFSLRYRLVDGQGNFGSVDGDNPAAMRYTEVRLTRLAEELMRDDIDKETVDFVPNYDGSEREPSVLPAKFPNLLVNGSSGIAVGIAGTIRPHSLGEVIEACLMVSENPRAEVKDLMAVMPGPDFPTAGFIHGIEGIYEAYKTGRGIIQVRARAAFETSKKSDKQMIVVTEIPYMTNKKRLIEKIAELVHDKKLDGISDLRDESDREGMRVVIELKRDAIAEVVLNNLYRNTQMQTTFGIIFLSIVNNKPEVMSLPTMLHHFLEHRKEIIVRRTRYELRKAEERAHILEGLVKALDHLDAVIALIRGSKTPPEAKLGLVSQFAFSELQAQAILEMRLQRLTGLERDKIVAEYQEVLVLITRLREILASEKLVLDIISNELREIKEQYGDARRTEIVPSSSDITIEDMIADEDMVITVSRGGKIKQTELASFSNVRTTGIIAIDINEGDDLYSVRLSDGDSEIFIGTHDGRAIRFRETDVRPMGRGAAGVKGITLRKGDYVIEMDVLPAGAEDIVGEPEAGSVNAAANSRGVHVLPVGAEDIVPEETVETETESEDESMDVTADSRGYILTVTEKGFGKRSPVSTYRLTNRGAMGVTNIRVTDKNGKVAGIAHVNGDEQILVITEQGMMIRTNVADMRSMGRSTQGVRVINIDGGDPVVGIMKLIEREAGDDEPTENGDPAEAIEPIEPEDDEPVH